MIPPLHTMLAGPLLSLFANVVDISVCLQLLDRVILQKTHALVAIIKHCLVTNRAKLLQMDPLLVSAYMVRGVYIDA